MPTLRQDIIYGARMLRKNPGFTAVAVIAIALGVGANTAIFSVVNTVLLRPLPYAEPERLVAVWERDTREALSKARPISYNGVAYPNFFDWRAQSQSFERIAVYQYSDFALTGGDAPVHLVGQVVSPDLFDLLGAQPRLGRWFTMEEEKPGNRVAVISYGLWQRQFGGDPEIVGRAVTLNAKPFTIVGVAPPGFQFPIAADPIELWVTSAVHGEKEEEDDKPQTEQRGWHSLQAIARLKPGVSIEQAQAEMDAIAANLEKQYPESNTYAGVAILPLHADLVTDYRPALLILFGAVAFVLLIACANVANLLLARATSRYKEIAVRIALGASRWRIIGQLLTESLLLALIGGVFGLLLAWWGTEALLGLIPEDVPRLSEVSLDRRVLGFTLLVSVLTGVIFGLAPALQASKTDLTEAMKESGRGASASGRRARLRSALVVTEVALALMLLVGAGLLLRTFQKVQQVDLGLDPHNVLTASVDLPGARYVKPEQSANFVRQVLERVRALPGVTAASGILPLPLSGNNFGVSLRVEGQTYAPGEEPSTALRVTGLDYFKTMKIPFVNGRDFTPRDDRQATRVAIINETFAKRYFPGEDPIGKRIKPGISVDEDGPPMREIIGVVKDVRHKQELDKESGPEMYLPHAQVPFGGITLVVRTQTDPRSLARPVQGVIAEIDKDIPLYDIKTFDQHLGNAFARPQFSAFLLGVFAVVALLLTAVGLYGVMAYSVAQRTHEIGIRVALGAQQGQVMSMVIRQGVTLAAVGVVLGLVGAFGLTRVLLATMLYGVSALDPLTFAFVVLLLFGVALAACAIPARRATKVDPMVALRYE
ncbi:MAG TPA: ABC transporter permease [Blastocatellia bacterium]|nr:ABC transporter permease [Blastocatellia bacterium]